MASTNWLVRFPQPLNPWLRERLGQARYRFEYQWLWIHRYDRLRGRDIRGIRQATAQLAINRCCR